MALTNKQREIVSKNIGFLDGIGWLFVLDEKFQSIAEALDAVCDDLRKVLDEDGEMSHNVGYTTGCAE